MMPTMPFPPIADSHAHLYEDCFAEDLVAVIARAQEAGVSHIVIPAVNYATSVSSLALAKSYPQLIKVALGLHPGEVKSDFEQQLGKILPLLEEHTRQADSPLVAVGEIGLDYYWDTTYKEAQKEALGVQLEWALRLDLPVILHTREAHSDMVEMVARYAPKGLRGVFHSFTGDKTELQDLLAFERFMVSINGIVTFKNSRTLQEAVCYIPSDRLLIETDAPYLAPVPKRGKRNEPAYLCHTLQVLASLRGETPEDLATTTLENTQKLFFRRGKSSSVA